jgi:hypothetical protein
MNVNFPGSAPVVTRRSRPRIVQPLSGPAARGIAVGATVERGQPLRDGADGGAAHTIGLADRLGCSPAEAEMRLVKPIGSRFEVGDEIASVRKGFRGQSVTAPFAGTLKSYNRQSGVAVFTSSDLNDECALVSGVVSAVTGDSVTIQFAGSSVFGVVGAGPNGVGPIRLVSSDPSHVAAPGEISDALRGAVVVAGPWTSAAVLMRLCEVKAAAVICGGFDEAELAAAFGVPDGQPSEMWPSAGASLSTPIALITTEGFGKLPIHPVIWAFFQEYEGRDALVTTLTSLVGHLARPQIIVEERTSEVAPAPMLAIGSQLRLVDPSNLGQAVEATSKAFKARDDRGRLVDAIEVRWPNGRTQTVPLAAVELIA